MSKRIDNQSGMVLITTVLICALVAVIALQISWRSRLHVRLMIEQDKSMSAKQAWVALKQWSVSAIQNQIYAHGSLFQKPENVEQHLSMAPWKVDVRWEDAQAALNINQLKNTAMAPSFARVFMSATHGTWSYNSALSFAQKIASYMNGKMEGEPQGPVPAITSVAMLNAYPIWRGVSSAHHDELLSTSWLTALPPDALLNVNTASASLILSLFNNSDDAQKFLVCRSQQRSTNNPAKRCQSMLKDSASIFSTDSHTLWVEARFIKGDTVLYHRALFDVDGPMVRVLWSQ